MGKLILVRHGHTALNKPGEDERLRQRLRELAHQFRRFGYRRLHDRLQREGWRVNHKRVGRLYRVEGLQVRKRRRKRCSGAPRLPLPVPTGVIGQVQGASRQVRAPGVCSRVGGKGHPGCAGMPETRK